MLRAVQEIAKLDDQDAVFAGSSLDGIVEEPDGGTQHRRFGPKIPVVDRADLKPFDALL